MKKLICLVLTAAAATFAHAQYYGQPIFSEGFDADEIPAEWTQINESEGNTTFWTLSDGEIASFSDIVPSNKRSARINISGKDTKLTLTSPEIDAVDVSNIQAGFYGYELSYAFRSNVDFRFRASHDGGQTWTDLFSSLPSGQFNGKPVGKWNLYKYSLPEEFNGKKITLQFYIDASTSFSTPGGLAGYIDGVFLSVQPECDPEVTAINFSTNDRRPTTGVFGDSEPVTLTIRNSGTRELTSAEAYFSVDGKEEISETATFSQPLQPGEESQFRFTRGADLSAPRATMTITAGIRADGDSDLSNNSITGYATNLLTDVPYVPFIEHEDGITTYSTDEWTTFENNNEAYWDYEDWRDFYWYIEAEWADESLDAWLVSRPVRFNAGYAYRLQFSAFSDDDYGAANRMAVYIARDPEMTEGLTQIWNSDNIDESNAKDQSAIFQTDETGPYYIGFKCYSEAGAAMMILQDVAVYKSVEKDVAVTAILSPLAGGYTYGDTEKVSASVYNFGSLPLSRGNAKINLTIDGETVLSEDLPDMAPNSAIDYEFAGTVDLSRLGHPYLLAVSAVLPGDEDKSNDSRELTVESTVADVPYVPEFGSQTSKGHELIYWTASDHNSDGYTFTPAYDSALGAYSFNYGGGMYGFTTVTLPSSDESLTSRPISLKGGKSYKLVFSGRVGKDGASLPLKVKLYRSGESRQEPVADILDTEVATPFHTEFINTFAVEADGVYELEFCVVHDQPIDYRIYLGSLRLTELMSNDLSVEEIVLPSTKISHVRTFPVGAVIRNNGTEAVNEFSISAESASFGTKTATFDEGISIEPDNSYLIYFGENFTFDGSGDEVLTITALADNDGCAENNSKKTTLSYIDPIELPYKPLPEEAMTHTGAYNLNRDNFRFVPDRSMGIGHIFVANDPVANNDYVATPGLSMRSGTTMQVSFSYYVLEGDVSDMSVYAFDLANETVVPIADLRGVSQNSMSRFTGYLEVPCDGVYSIAVQPGSTSASLFVSAPISVEEINGHPDLRIGALETHLTPAVLSDNESVTVNFTSESDFGLESVPFTLTVGDATYHAIFTRYTSKSDTDTHHITFDGVDFQEPGEYSVTCAVGVNADANPDDNSATFTISSLPVVDIAVKGLVSPQSGSLSKEENITVEIENLGKGSVEGVKLTCKVTAPDGSATTLSGTMESPVTTSTPASYTFAETVDMYEEGIYTFDITAEADDDIKLDNNTLTANINSTPKAFDAGITEITKPVDAAHGNEVEVCVAVANYGETVLFNVPVTVEAEGPDGTAKQSISGTVTEIPAGGTIEYTLPSTLDLKTCGDYVITAFTAVANDADPTNDRCVKTVRCLTQDVGVTAIISPADNYETGLCDVTIEVTNFGEAPVAGIPVMYLIGSIPQLDTMDDEIAPGETARFTFGTPYEFTDLRPRHIVAATRLENDANPDNDSIEIDINGANGVSDIELSVKMSPNPTRGYLTISAPSAIAEIEIYDMSGRRAASFNGDNSSRISLSLALAPGSYIVKVHTAHAILTETLIVR